MGRVGQVICFTHHRHLVELEGRVPGGEGARTGGVTLPAVLTGLFMLVRCDRKQTGPEDMNVMTPLQHGESRCRKTVVLLSQ
jgi:hypothetical protein